MNRIAITMDGGVIQNILADEDVEVVVVDYDTEGADEEEVTEVLGNEAIVTVQSVEVGHADLETIYKNTK